MTTRLPTPFRWSKNRTRSSASRSTKTARARSSITNGSPSRPYLRGAIREETHVDYDDAVRSYTQVVNWEPGFKQAKEDLHRAKFGHHSDAGHGVVYIFALVGRGPYKEQINAEATQLSLLIADRILSATNKHSLPPTVAPVPVPMVVRSPCRLRCLGVIVNGEPGGVTETITHIGRMAVDQHRAVFPQIVARAIVRRVVKKGTIYGIKEAVQVENPYANLALDVAGIVWEATERADTRCWGLLPDRIQVLRLELPEGTHRLGLQGLGQTDTRSVILITRKFASSTVATPTCWRIFPMTVSSAVF